VHDEWFADEELVRKIVGLPEKHMELPNDREVHHASLISIVLLVGYAHFLSLNNKIVLGY